jgi:hypothetical protein
VSTLTIVTEAQQHVAQISDTELHSNHALCVESMDRIYLYAHDVPNVVCAAPSENKQVVVKTLRSLVHNKLNCVLLVPLC